MRLNVLPLSALLNGASRFTINPRDTIDLERARERANPPNAGVGIRQLRHHVGIRSNRNVQSMYAACTLRRGGPAGPACYAEEIRKKEYDFSTGKRIPCAKQLKHSVTMRVYRTTLAYFKGLAGKLESSTK